MKSKLLLALVTVISLSACGDKKVDEKEKPTGEKVLLRFTPKKGNSYHIVYTSEMNMPSVGDKTVSNLEVKILVDSIAGNKSWMSAMFSHFDFTNTSVGVTASFNSDKDTNGTDPSIRAMFAPIIAIMNKSATMKVDDQLKIIKQPNFDSLVPKEYRLGMTSIGLEKSFEEFFVVWPTEEVYVGSTWNRDMNVMEEMELNIKANYKVEKIDKEYVYLKLVADINSNEERMGVKIKVRGKIKGTSKVRREDGWIMESDISLDLTLKSPGKEDKFDNRIKVITK